MQCLPEAIEALKPCRKTLIFSGAGISTGSGIPDFRGPNGVWKRRQPVYFDEFLSSEDKRVEHWEFKLEAWEGFRDARPNAAHLAVAELHGAGRVGGVVTQNIDGLHQKSGIPEGDVVELHGTNMRVTCVDCGADEDPQTAYDVFRETGACPRCAECGGFLKPATISFGQALRQEDMDRAFAIAEEVDAVVSIGSTLSVQPACMVPLLAAQRGIPYIIINQGDTDHDNIALLTARLEGDAGEMLPALVDGVLA